MARRAARIDKNHKKIVDGLKAVGATVQSMASLGKGCPDILVGYHGLNFVFEIKNPDASGAGLTAWEADWMNRWRGQKDIVWTLDEALEIIGAAKKPTTRRPLV